MRPSTSIDALPLRLAVVRREFELACDWRHSGHAIEIAGSLRIRIARARMCTA
jgi:hypothetical protein